MFSTNQIVSLWDMQKFDLAGLFQHYSLVIKGRAALDLMANQGQAICLSNEMLAWISEISRIAEPLGMTGTVKAAKRLSGANVYQDGPTIRSLLQDFELRIKDELEDVTFLQISSRSAQIFQCPEDAFGQDALAAFPSIEFDVREAGRASALGLHTASVFHCMRIMEVGLEALGAKLNVDIASNWNNALNQIEKEIRGRSTATHGQTWKNDEGFYSEAATHFRVVKNAWRNHTMHKRETFDEDRARGILQSTVDFMRHLATRLSE